MSIYTVAEEADLSGEFETMEIFENDLPPPQPPLIHDWTLEDLGIGQED